MESFPVVPVHPLQDLELDVLEGPPGAVASDELGLEEPVEGLGGGVVVGVTGAADGGGDACLGQAFAVADGQVLTGFNQWKITPRVGPVAGSRKVTARRSALSTTSVCRLSEKA